jgi:hypothetical protein
MRRTFHLRIIATKTRASQFQNRPVSRDDRMSLSRRSFEAIALPEEFNRMMNEGIGYDIEISNGTRRDER